MDDEPQQLSIVPNVDPTVKGAGGARVASAELRGRLGRDLVWECMYLAQTLTAYEIGAPLTGRERAKINAATRDVKAAGFSVDDVRTAITGWPAAMGSARITAMGLAGNLTRCLNAAKGAQSMVEMTDVERALRAWEATDG